METENRDEKVTTSELSRMIGRGFESVQEEINGLKGEITKLDSKIDGLREELKEEMSEKFDRVLGVEDRLVKRIEDQETENTMSVAAGRRHQDKLDDHEERIRTVENKLGIARAEC